VAFFSLRARKGWQKYSPCTNGHVHRLQHSLPHCEVASATSPRCPARRPRRAGDKWRRGKAGPGVPLLLAHADADAALRRPKASRAVSVDGRACSCGAVAANAAQSTPSRVVASTSPPTPFIVLQLRAPLCVPPLVSFDSISLHSAPLHHHSQANATCLGRPIFCNERSYQPTTTPSLQPRVVMKFGSLTQFPKCTPGPHKSAA
jgi:hypothetical protein